MFYIQFFVSLLEVVMVLIPSLLSVAFITVAERKTMASMQRRLGPNSVGYYGLLQAFADALKLLLKEYVFPTQANAVLFFLGPVVTLIFSLLGFYVIPFAPGITISDFNLGILYMLAMSSLSTYGILLAGWSANSKYAFLGSLRSTAQLISYELILGSAILLVILLSGSLSITSNIEAQKAVWYIFPICPVFLIFFMGSVAETNRAPFDLVEAESELVSGFMTEHSGVIFVFFFLAEYASILLICILTTALFLGGYVFDSEPVFNTILFLSSLFLRLIEGIEYLLSPIINYIADYLNSFRLYIIFSINYIVSETPVTWSEFMLYFFALQNYISTADISDVKSSDLNIALWIFDWLRGLIHTSFLSIILALNLDSWIDYPEHLLYQYQNNSFSSNPLIEGIKCSAIFGLKSCVMVFAFIWARASYPRIRYDQLMSYCWTILLPIIIALIVIIPCVLYNFSILPSNICLFLFFLSTEKIYTSTETYKSWSYNLKRSYSNNSKSRSSNNSNPPSLYNSYWPDNGPDIPISNYPICFFSKIKSGRIADRGGKPYHYVNLYIGPRLPKRRKREDYSSKMYYELDTCFYPAMTWVYQNLTLFKITSSKILPFPLYEDSYELQTFLCVRGFSIMRRAIVEQQRENIYFFHVLIKKALEIESSNIRVTDKKEAVDLIHLYLTWWFRKGSGLVIRDTSRTLIQISKNIVRKGQQPFFKKDNFKQFIRPLYKIQAWRTRKERELKGILDRIAKAPTPIDELEYEMKTLEERILKNKKFTPRASPETGVQWYMNST